MRMYPQALLKQMKLKEHPQYSSSDINAFFNSDANFWFMDDGHFINRDQNDFLYAITHELFHGLGVTTNWIQYFTPYSQGFTPFPRFSKREDGKLVFHGFIEAAFDRYLVEAHTSRSISHYTKALNSFVPPGTVFQNETEFMRAFNQSRQSTVASHFHKLATTKNAITFRVGKKASKADDIVLETSLNPFIPGSGITHLDYTTYSNTSDFLMRFTQLFGENLLTDVDIGGQYVAGPIGPRLTTMMRTLGYRINPKPESWVDILKRRYPLKGQ
ncbi:hypothetical protein K493DRAFT_277530 [Basidiobolus meristosporus CBS 931.73]|uniref:Sequence orphan n=1 Tax=Basidiobolus meristosporus CBS 931.73 TaxID=1314790 RepID=A0A1Y1YWN8_9FUNG|nr:hypothetical protein K493DRAFT_277530 [Basidiobolus meristosporus CBS 931.73]|eukprot:ORY02117.1 hypothetical protein K493DRAFT_277530 [Basidiobolus meristosporus CBS 931.73]